MSPAFAVNAGDSLQGLFGGGGISTANYSLKQHANKPAQLLPPIAPTGVPIPAMDDGTGSFPPTPDSAKLQNMAHYQQSQPHFSHQTDTSNGLGPPRQFRPPFEPRSYTILKEVGDGSFGTVWLADWHSELQIPPGTLPPGPSSRPEYKGKQLVAVKRMKKAFEGGWDECMRLKELRSLRSIPEHPNIIPLYDAFLSAAKELYFVFECMEGNLYQLTKSRKGRALASGLIASIFHQTLCAVDHIHSHGFFHRDIKPENLLITTTGLADYPSSSLYALPGAPPEKDVTVLVKLADFGLARETNSRPPYTEYVSTRWYRAPEVLLRSREYSCPVDMWAVGTVLIEVVTLKPLFPGDSEIDQVYKICSVLGDPSTDYGLDERGRTRGGGFWERGTKLASAVGFNFPKMAPKSLNAFFDAKTVPNQLIDCITDMIRYEPARRLTAADCLRHPYFFEIAPRFAPLKQTAGFAPTNASGTSLSSARPVPPSHSYTSSNRPIFPSNSSAAAAEQYAATHPPSSTSNSGSANRQSSVSSHLSGMSGLGVRLDASSSAHSPSLSFPETVKSSSNGMASPGVSTAPWSHDQASISSFNGADGPRVIPPFGTSLQRRPSISGSIAASTFYDGSIFEGIAPTRAASIMSFPQYNAQGHSPSSHHLGAYAMGRMPSQESLSPALAQNSSFDALSVRSDARRQPQPVHSSAQSFVSVAPSTKSRWGLGSVFSSSSSSQQPHNAASTSSPNPLKRSPSNSQMSMQVDGSSSVPLDPKQAKKAAKEAERLKREAMQVASRERARAVMRKKNQLMEAADPLHNYTPAQNGDSAVPVDKGKARASMDRISVRSSSMASKMPQIVEDTSRLYVSKSRRLADDDDVHSISSTSTGHSSQRGGRPVSVFSVATSASDPERFTRHHLSSENPGPYGAPGRRAPSLHSVQSTGSAFYSYGPAPNTGHSSLDSQLIAHMQGLATNGEAGWRSPAPSERSESVPRAASHRATSPVDERSQRFTPYNLPHHSLGSSSGSVRNGVSSAPSHSLGTHQFHPTGLPSMQTLPGGSKSMPAGELPQVHSQQHMPIYTPYPHLRPDEQQQQQQQQPLQTTFGNYQQNHMNTQDADMHS